MAPTTYTESEGRVDLEFDNDYISKKQYYEAIGQLSATLASASGAWDGNAPDWFPEPPEWLRLADQCLADTEPDPDTLLEEEDAVVWAETFVDLVHKNPSIAFDVGTMITWFANAFQRGEWNSEAYKRETAEMMEQIFAEETERKNREHPLYAAVDPGIEAASIVVIYEIAPE